mmetsp:Transcript_11249/g.21138  ORF Transcript_11249/g.21138 Transcript_11249/m.21138 type:complete len:382 (-) Transcript_11249:899-2044(-)
MKKLLLGCLPLRCPSVEHLAVERPISKWLQLTRSLDIATSTFLGLELLPAYYLRLAGLAGPLRGARLCRVPGHVSTGLGLGSRSHCALALHSGPVVHVFILAVVVPLLVPIVLDDHFSILARFEFHLIVTVPSTWHASGVHIDHVLAIKEIRRLVHAQIIQGSHTSLSPSSLHSCRGCHGSLVCAIATHRRCRLCAKLTHCHAVVVFLFIHVSPGGTFSCSIARANTVSCCGPVPLPLLLRLLLSYVADKRQVLLWNVLGDFVHAENSDYLLENVPDFQPEPILCVVCPNKQAFDDLGKASVQACPVQCCDVHVQEAKDRLDNLSAFCLQKRGHGLLHVSHDIHANHIRKLVHESCEGHYCCTDHVRMGCDQTTRDHIDET